MVIVFLHGSTACSSHINLTGERALGRSRGCWRWWRDALPHRGAQTHSDIPIETDTVGTIRKQKHITSLSQIQTRQLFLLGCSLLLYMPVPMFSDHLTGKSQSVSRSCKPFEASTLARNPSCLPRDDTWSKGQLAKKRTCVGKKNMETAFPGWGQLPDSRVNVVFFWQKPMFVA